MTTALDRQVDDLVTRTHGDGIQALAAAALIEHKGRFLLIEKPSPDFELTASTWELPTVSVLPGETVIAALQRGMSHYYGLDDVAADRYLGHTDHLDDDGRVHRVLVFAVTTESADNICKLGCLGHYWIDTLSITDTIDGINDLLRAYYTDNTS